MNFVTGLLQLIGSLAFLLYGMKLMSDGVQKSAGERLQRALSVMTGNRFKGLLTGLFITMVIQSSGATTVMVVTFVNAGLLTLQQSVGVIFGANIGTTITAWIVSIFGFNFKIAAFAIPIFGAGFFLTLTKRSLNKNIGQALMGFGLLFLGLSMLSDSLSFKPEQLSRFSWIDDIQSWGVFSLVIAIIVGIIVTTILHSSSAFSAIVITMAYNNLIAWEFSAALILGSGIGSTIDAILAAFGSNADAKRAAFIHVFFNVAGTILALIFYSPFLRLIDAITPRAANIAIKISILQSAFKVLSTILFLPFTKQIIALSKRFIPDDAKGKNNIYRLDFIESALVKENVGAYIIRAEKEIKDLTDLATDMFDLIQIGLKKRDQTFIDEHLEEIMQAENYADQMHEQLTRYIVHIERMAVNEKQLDNLSLMLSIIGDLESMTDECLNIALLLKRSIEKSMSFETEDTDRLIPYVELVRQFLQFIHININKHLDPDKLSMAEELENQIDMFRKNLKKIARKRLENGADVKAELLYIDIVRQIEKIGDRAFGIAEALGQTQ
ncbi:MAG: Na/Pi cotransporter family protein [Treponema sp.]|nr:Na/Pi cotransporter family protein [Treponema sp.]MEE3435931.1 Na/Pi cotransporter family protein [Treponema sp.]